MEEEVRVLKSVTCPSLSGKSKLTYQFGVLNEKDAQLRLWANSGGGMFAKDWVPLADVIKVLKSPDVKESISATSFQPLFEGRSINSQSFLLAILKQEGAVRPHSVKPRAYEVGDVQAFQARIAVLIEPGSAGTGVGKGKPKKSAQQAVSRAAAAKD